MAYDFHDYIADLLIGAQQARNDGSHGSAAMLDDQLGFAVQDAHRAGAITDVNKFGSTVAHRVVTRGGAGLHDLLTKAPTPAA